MSEPEQPKSRRGRPPKYAGQGKRQNFNFRITEKTRERLIERVKQSGRSISEEIEFRLTRDLSWEATREDIEKLRQEASAQLSAARVQAIRAAGLQILREIEGRPTRVIVDLETLLAEADGLAAGLRPGFFAGESPPAPAAPRPMTAEEGERLMRELNEIKQSLKTAVEKTLAADAAAAAKDGDEAA
jgi:TraY domain